MEKLNVIDLLKNCSDNELYQIVTGVGGEIRCRIISTLKEQGCTSLYIPKENDCAIKVSDMFGTHKWEDGELDKWVTITEIGYTNIYEEGQVFNDVLYVVTADGIQYGGEEIVEDALWDVYHEIKEIIKSTKQ